ncbi:MAG: PIN domain-containing protein [Chloroflexi bacterium]|nr:PIN domain-containing protein [Ardenticatenaceae bacterium]MBL1129220.1 PIN domain-containing protein [Chloroflexota bacterium]NOG35295.1 PIN domain-containing protein [Chloroflexota bacterium]GIK58592.1 MAG: ribonuclease VapC [Chloroflexota bacterium]
MKSVIVDASFLVSLTSVKERQHAACLQVAQGLNSRLIIPITVIPEAAYLIARRISHRVMRAFLSKLQNPQWQIESITAADFERATQILDRYQDAELDFADSTIVAVAERLHVETILTLDRRDFQMIRPKHTPYFTLLP